MKPELNWADNATLEDLVEMNLHGYEFVIEDGVITSVIHT